MAIEFNQIAVNRYAPEESAAINLYSYAHAENLTLGQLMSAVCLRAGALLEARSIRKMNEMDNGSKKIEDLSDVLGRVSTEDIGSADWAVLRGRLGEEYGITSLPGSIASYEDKMTALTEIKRTLDQMTQLSQEDMIDLQSLVSARDVAFTTSTNLVHAVQGAAMRTAGLFK